jgi:hypothetical protein
MTARELTITKAVLEFLHEQDYAQKTPIEIHAAVNASPGIADPKPSVEELDTVLRNANTEGWISGVPGRFKKTMRWSITQAGEGARLEM